MKAISTSDGRCNLQCLGEQPITRLTLYQWRFLTRNQVKGNLRKQLTCTV